MEYNRTQQTPTYGPHNESETKHCQGNVPVGDLAYGGPGQDVVRHDLLHSYTDTCHVQYCGVGTHMSTHLPSNLTTHGCALGTAGLC